MSIQVNQAGRYKDAWLPQGDRITKPPYSFWLQFISVVRVIPGHLIEHGLCAAPLLQGGFGSLCLPAPEEYGAANRTSGDKLLQTSA